MSSFDNLSYVTIVWFICNWRDMSLAGLTLFKLYPTRKEKNWQQKKTIDMTLLSWSWLGRSIWTNTDLSASQKKEKSLLEMRELLLVRTNLRLSQYHQHWKLLNWLKIIMSKNIHERLFQTLQFHKWWTKNLA